MYQKIFDQVVRFATTIIIAAASVFTLSLDQAFAPVIRALVAGEAASG